MISAVVLLSAMTVHGTALAGDDAAPPAPVKHDGKSVSEWAQELSAEDVAIRKKAAYALWKIGSEASDAAIPLVRAIRDSDPYVRGTSAKAVQRLRPDALRSTLPELASQLEDEREEVRREAVTLFWRLGPLAAEAVPALTKALGSADPVVRANAAASLGNAGEAAKPALEVLVKRFSDQDEAVRQWAAKAVAGIDPATAFASDRSEVRLAALKVWGDSPPSGAWTRPEIVAGVLKTIDDPDEEVRGWAAHALDTFAAFAGDKRPVAWIPVFRKVLEKERAPAVRASGAFGLGRYTGHGTEVVGPLIDAAKSEEPEVKRAAVLALGWLRGEAKSAVPVILAALQNGDAETCDAATVALGGIGDSSEAVIDALVSATRIREGFASRNAIASLGTVGKGSSRAEAALVGLLKDESLSVFVRGAAASALARIGGGKDTIAALTSCFEGEHGGPVEVAYALCVLDAPLAPKALDRLADCAKDPKNPFMALSLLRQLGPKAAKAVPAVVELLAATDRNFRLTAAGVLGAIGPAAKEGLPALELAAKDGDPDVAAAAKLAIDAIREKPEGPK